ncbi:type II toxin-antitoxin system VapC family toxin [Leptolyngbya sp. 15MV]|nr:type II toxin-antitoxin system VapC family toxin [Leptolyngbya sp. 15MV]
MSRLFLLDANILSHAMRNTGGLAARRIQAAAAGECATSIIVAAELRFGAEKRGSAELRRRVEATLHAIPIHPFASPADAVYGRLRVQLEAAGRPIGPNDMLIAAHALALDATLVSANEREFRRVTGLRVENWLAA